MGKYLILLIAAGSSLVLTGCSGAEHIAYAGFPSSSRLTTDTQDGSGRVPYSYPPSVAWRRYSKVIIDPVVICQGADNQFGDMAPDDRAALAKAMTSQFTTRLAGRYAVTEVPGPSTLRVELTLKGAKATRTRSAVPSSILATATKLIASRTMASVQEQAEGWR